MPTLAAIPMAAVSPWVLWSPRVATGRGLSRFGAGAGPRTVGGLLLARIRGDESVLCLKGWATPAAGAPIRDLTSLIASPNPHSRALQR